MLSLDIAAPDALSFAEDIEGLGHALGDLSEPSREAASRVLGDVEAPRRTGALADTVTADITPLGFTLTAGGARAPYAAVVHARDPFLTRALLADEEAVLDIYAEDVADTITEHIH